MRRRSGAFTLVELIAVLAIVATLLALLVPGVAAVKAAVARARTAAMFHQWTLACAQFRQEYGRPPSWSVDTRLETTAQVAAFVRALTGRNPDGTMVADAAQLGGNTRRLAFLAFGPADLAAGQLVDAFGNTEFGALVDRDGDGWVRPNIDGVPVAVRSVNGAAAFAPSSSLLPPEGVRADVLFYSAGRGRSADDLVVSWR